MKNIGISVKSWLSRVTAVLGLVCIASGFAAAGGRSRYLVTNDDVPPRDPTSVTFYTVGTNGQLTMKGKVLTGGVGIAAGFFGANRVNVLDSGTGECVYASEATSGDVVGIVVRTMQVGGRATGSTGDLGFSNGIGLTMNASYLYASFSDSNTIGTFQVLPGCTIGFVGDTAVAGLQAGAIDGMAIHGDMLVATYADGSIESFNISAGMPVSNGDEQNSTGSVGGNTYPSGVDITRDGHYAIFGDVSSSTVIEVSDISSGKLTGTVVYYLGNGISSSNILLSPDETVLYISNTQGDRVTAAFFDKNTGEPSTGCTSGRLRGYVTAWSYLGALALEKTTGTGGAIYVAEYGAPSSIGVIKMQLAGGKCTLKEAPGSPVADPNSPGLLSLGTFPPRPF